MQMSNENQIRGNPLAEAVDMLIESFCQRDYRAKPY